MTEHPPRETTRWSRRAAMAALPALALTAAACSSAEPSRSVDEVRHDAGPPPKAATPDQAIDVLMQGNARFASHQPQIRDTADIEVLWTEIVNGQEPFAIVLGCADSRLAPELIFDQFVGDIFVVREAGNIAVSPTNLGSLEYGHAVLKAKALLVLGHSSCGAVKAAYENQSPGANIQAIVDAIKPGIAGARDESDAIARNVSSAIAHVRSASTLLNDAEKSGAFKIVGAVYDIRAATVRLL
ncbi:carbonic anhydrase [Mycobacterium sp. RTGN5]|uniref:carbonic anhydrase n=1 Tax=Mycobacterium sp. RTGN5 TaxID=3016522 RepID=UPI0029C83DC2|nr:carbonic anhydrase [Mycobacterium sp. RTGN5]